MSAARPLNCGLQNSCADRADATIAHTSLDGLVQPEDIAHACLFLLSDKASFITGIDIVVDGAIMAKLLPGALTAVTR